MNEKETDSDLLIHTFALCCAGEQPRGNLISDVSEKCGKYRFGYSNLRFHKWKSAVYFQPILKKYSTKAIVL